MLGGEEDTHVAAGLGASPGSVSRSHPLSMSLSSSFSASSGDTARTRCPCGRGSCSQPRDPSTQLLDEPPIGGVPESPVDAFPQAGLDPTLIAVPIEHLEQLGASVSPSNTDSCTVSAV